MNKDYFLRVRLDAEELALLDDLVQVTGHTRSSYLRLLIRITHNNKFPKNRSKHPTRTRRASRLHRSRNIPGRKGGGDEKARM